jgi:hypothetical protein
MPPWSDMADRMLGVAVRTFSHAGESGEPLVEYIPQSGSAFTISGVFDKAYVAVTAGNEASFSDAFPALGVQLSQFAVPPEQDDQVRIDGVLYRVDDVQPDGVAGALLKLFKV